jgi:hypothetical protein
LTNVPHRTTAIALAALVVCLVLASSLHFYFLSDGSGGMIFWRPGEAYLFLGAAHIGYRISYLEFPFVAIGEYFYWVPYTDDVHNSSIVFRITSSSVERHFVDYGYGWDAHSPAFLTPFEDTIYASCLVVRLCKWNGKSFEPATEDERRRFGGDEALVKGDMNNQVVNGTHARDTEVLVPGNHFDIAVGNNLTLSVDARATGVPAEDLARRVTIELLRPNQPPEMLYDVDGAQRTVSKNEYENMFRSRYRPTIAE